MRPCKSKQGGRKLRTTSVSQALVCSIYCCSSKTLNRVSQGKDMAIPAQSSELGVPSSSPVGPGEEVSGHGRVAIRAQRGAVAGVTLALQCSPATISPFLLGRFNQNLVAWPGTCCFLYLARE